MAHHYCNNCSAGVFGIFFYKKEKGIIEPGQTHLYYDLKNKKTCQSLKDLSVFGLIQTLTGSRTLSGQYNKTK
jgi:hypothetical protein